MHNCARRAARQKNLSRRRAPRDEMSGMAQDPSLRVQFEEMAPLEYASPGYGTDATTFQRVAALLTCWIVIMFAGVMVFGVAENSVALAIGGSAFVLGILIAWGVMSYRSAQLRGIASSIFADIGLGLLCQGLCYLVLSH